jgi:hypothetical protein
MAVASLKRSTLKLFTKYNSMLAGNTGALPDYELISTTVLSSTTASVTFSGLGTSAAGYKHLQIRAVTRNAWGAPGSATNYGANGLIRFNGDSASNYRAHYLQGDGGSTGGGDYGSVAACYVPDLGGVWDSHTAGSYGAFVVDVLDFSASSKNRTIRTFGGFIDGGKRITLSSAAWFSTAAVTSIVISEDGSGGGFKTGSRFSLYGLRG